MHMYMIVQYVMLHTGEVWFTQTIPVVVPAEGTLCVLCNYILKCFLTSILQHQRVKVL